MSDLESFSFEESNQGSTPETFKLFQERMKAASSQIQAIRAGEQRQKKKEDELAKILSEFIKSLQHDSVYAEFLVHVSKLLGLNVPAAFILVLIIINFPKLQQQTGLKLITFEEAARAGALETQTLPDLYLAENALPPFLKIAIDAWIQEISQVATDNRSKLLQRALTLSQEFFPEIDQMMAYNLTFYLEKNGFPIAEEFAQTFSRFCLKGILDQIKKPLQELPKPGDKLE